MVDAAQDKKNKIERAESVEDLEHVCDDATELEQAVLAPFLARAFRTFARNLARDLDRTEKLLAEAEERITSLENEAAGEDDRRAEAVKEALDEAADEGAGDVAILAEWLYDLGAAYSDIVAHVASDAGREAARVEWQRHAPVRPVRSNPLFGARRVAVTHRLPIVDDDVVAFD